MSNKNLHRAKAAKNDEFYTKFRDIEREVMYYYEYNNDVFRDKVVLCPCDDPETSNFTRFFAANFTRFGLRKFISTSYSENGKGRKFVIDRDVNGDGVIDHRDIEWEELEGNGDFASTEVTALRDESDIICTNPPFSLFRKFLTWIMEGRKQFLILGNKNAVEYREVFPLIKDNIIWLGVSSPLEFDTPYGPTKQVQGLVRWFTNMEHTVRHYHLNYLTVSQLVKLGYWFNRYDNYDAIEVPDVSKIPIDYVGVMGVPITFLDHYNPDMFEIVGSINAPLLDGKYKYKRLLIRSRLGDDNEQRSS